MLLTRIEDNLFQLGNSPMLISLLSWLKLRVNMHEKNQPIGDKMLRLQVQLDRRLECITVIKQALYLINRVQLSTEESNIDIGILGTDLENLENIALTDSLQNRSNSDLLQILLSCQQQLKI